MASSVTVEDNLRKKIKKIAAHLDTTQGDVIARAIELLEDKLDQSEINHSSKARKIMRQAAINVQNDKERQMVRKKLSAPGIDIKDVRITKWGAIDENLS